MLSYWHIGKAIKTQVLQGDRAACGAGVLKQLAGRLTHDYGSGFSYSGLTRMAKLFDYLPDEPMIATLSQQLSWSHFVKLIKINDPTQRAFYFKPAHKGQVERFLKWLARYKHSDPTRP